MKELTIPAAAKRDGDSVEVLRVWFAENGLWISLNPNVFRERDFDEADAWGIMLADTIRHLSNALCLKSGKNKKETMRLIKQALDREIAEQRPNDIY